MLHWYGGLLNFLFIFYSNRKFWSRGCSAVRLFWFSVTPGKLYLAPKVLLGGLRDRTVEYTTWVWGFTKLAKSIYSNRKFRSLKCATVLIFRNPRKAMFGPESASWGVTGSYSSVCYIWVWGNTKFSKSFHCNRKFRSRRCSAALNFRNPQKAMFGPESASWGVTGSYRSGCYIGMGAY